MKTIKFRDLLIGDTFDFIDDNNRLMNSFYDRCVKTSSRTYKSIELNPHYDGKSQVGSINAIVHHVKSRTDSTVHARNK